MNGVPFVWDTKKAATNLVKHGVSLSEACEAFFDPFLKLVDASRNDEGREAIIGYSKRERLLFVVYRDQKQNAFRIISARRATKQEREYYEDI